MLPKKKFPTNPTAYRWSKVFSGVHADKSGKTQVVVDWVSVAPDLLLCGNTPVASVLAEGTDPRARNCPVAEDQYPFPQKHLASLRRGFSLCPMGKNGTLRVVRPQAPPFGRAGLSRPQQVRPGLGPLRRPQLRGGLFRFFWRGTAVSRTAVVLQPLQLLSKRKPIVRNLFERLFEA